MHIQRTITILIVNDPDLRNTLDAFRQVQQALSAPCYNDGKPLGALALQLFNRLKAPVIHAWG